MKTLYTGALALLLSIVALGCEGPVGPPGPPGYDANVGSFTFEFDIDDVVINGNVASAQYDVPSITASVVEDGAVLVYFRDQNTWTALPYTYGVESPDLPAVDYTVSFGYAFDRQFLELFYEASTDAVDLTEQPDRLIKVVVIDGVGLGKTGVDWRDYEAVRNYFGLPE